MAIWAKRRRRTSLGGGVDLGQLLGVEGRAPSMPRSGSGSRACAVAVLVVAVAALAAEPAFGDQLLLDRARAPALRLAALGEEGAGDFEVDVEADQVDQLERAHPEAAAEADDAVDRRRVGDAVAEHPQRLQREGAGEAVGDEAGAVLGPDRGPAHPLGDLGRRRQRRLGGALGGDDLDQLHQRRRVEEVHADDALGVGHAGGDLGDPQRGGVAGEDRLGAADRGQLR